MSTAIFDLTHSCLELFDRQKANHDSTLLTHLIPLCDDDVHRKAPPCDFLGIRNSFLFWIDYTGALSLVESSLDARLEGLTDISTVVLELLETILRSLHRLETVPSEEALGASSGTSLKPQVAQLYITRWESACEAIQSGLDELHFVALAIRKASAKRLDQIVATATTPEDAVFRQYIVTLVRFRFPAARQTLCQQLGESIADRRQMILQRKRHAKKLAIRREALPSVPTASSKAKHSEAEPVPQPQGTAQIAPRPSEVVSAVTKASRPDRRLLEIHRLDTGPPKALSTARSTISTSMEHSFEYPELPKAKEGEARIQCPFCFVPLDRSGTEKKRQDDWKRHVDEHTQPYPCLFPQCAKAFTFFLRRHDWKAHMEKSHSRDWLRKVHTMSWYCDIDHEEPPVFETESEWREHMEDLSTHAKRNLKPPSQAQLDALAPRKQRVARRDYLVCPLCEQIPRKLQPVAREGHGNSIELENQVVGHVADHLKSLSMLVLPSLQDADGNLGSSRDSVEMMGEDHKKELNNDSIAHPPSGINLLEEFSNLPEDWGVMTLDELEEHHVLDVEAQTWDPDYKTMAIADYTPDCHFEPVWSGPWLSTTKHDEDSMWDGDPVLSAFMVNWTDSSGRGTLHEAAEMGDLPVVLKLLELGRDVNAAASSGDTPLTLAISKGHPEVAQALIAHGASVKNNASSRPPPLITAVYNRQTSLIIPLLKAGADPNEQNQKGQTAELIAMDRDILDWKQVLEVWRQAAPPSYEMPTAQARLWTSIGLGYEHVIDQALEDGADLSASDANANSALHLAVTETADDDVLRIVQKLIRLGAPTTLHNASGMIPIASAAQGCYYPAVYALLTAQVDVGEHLTPVQCAIFHRDSNILRTVLEQGADPNATTDTARYSPLHLATSWGEAGLVRILLDFEASPRDEKEPFLSVVGASWQESPEILQLVLEAGADLDQAVHKGITALQFAARRGHTDMIRFLLQHEASQSWNDLLIATQAGREEAVQLLLEAGANVHEADEKGWTPLHHAAARGRVDIIRLLLHNNANPNARGFMTPNGLALGRADQDRGQGNMPIHVSAWEDHPDAVKAFLEAGMHPDCRGAGDMTSLHFAAMTGHDSVAEVLFTAGCTLDTKDAEGRTALLHAVINDHPDTVRLLLTQGATTLRSMADKDDLHTLVHWAAQNDYIDITMFIRLSISEFNEDKALRDEIASRLQAVGTERHIRVIRDDDFGEEGTMTIKHPGMRMRLIILGKLASSMPLELQQSFILDPQPNFWQEVQALRTFDTELIKKERDVNEDVRSQLFGDRA